MEHHRWWMSNNKLQPTDFGVQEHEHGMRAFQYFGETDQLDLPNLAGLEVLMRRAQMIEYHHEKRTKAANAGDGKSGGVTCEEASYFSGSHKLNGEVMVTPDLLAWVGKEIERDVEVTKQMRKAREEQRLSRDKP